MAQRIVLVDDLDGETGAHPVRFSLDGQGYVIDLSESNRKSLETALAPFVAAAKKEAQSRGHRSASQPSRRGRRDVSEVREWARANGYEVASQGRIPREVQSAFDAR